MAKPNYWAPEECSDLLECWMPAKPLASASVLADLRGELDRRFVTMDQTAIDTIFSRAVGFCGCWSAEPHTDPSFPPWFVIYAIKASERPLFVADAGRDAVQRSGRPPVWERHTSVILASGCLAVFNGHNVHWLPEVDPASPFIWVPVDLEARPTRAEAEAAISEKIADWASTDLNLNEAA